MSAEQPGPPSLGYEATYLQDAGEELHALYLQLMDTKTRLFVAHEDLQPEIRAEVSRLTEIIRKRLREEHHADNSRGATTA